VVEQALLINFRLSRSPLWILVSVFAGQVRTLAAYQEAIKLRRRFFSFGDCMIIL
jgi:S-adenosylmethionine:tRNA ribosyltransferase-isomerase